MKLAFILVVLTCLFEEARMVVSKCFILPRPQSYELF